MQTPKVYVPAISPISHRGSSEAQSIMVPTVSLTTATISISNSYRWNIMNIMLLHSWVSPYIHVHTHIHTRTYTHWVEYWIQVNVLWLTFRLSTASFSKLTTSWPSQLETLKPLVQLSSVPYETNYICFDIFIIIIIIISSFHVRSRSEMSVNQSTSVCLFVLMIHYWHSQC